MATNNTISTPSQAQVSESNFISKVYLWMAGGLGLSALASLWMLSQPVLLKAILTNGFALGALVIAELGLVIWLSAGLMTMSSQMAKILFCAYSFLNGVTLCSIFIVYTGASIATTFAITAGTFLFFSVYGLTTKKDLTSVGSLAMMGLIGVIIASLVNLFLKSPAMYWVITYVGIAVFLGLIAYDTQALKRMHAEGFQDAQMEKKLAIFGALRLYLDFINLFLMLLRAFGNRK